MENSTPSTSLSTYLVYGILAIISAGILYLFYWANKRFSENEKILDGHSDFLARMYQNSQSSRSLEKSPREKKRPQKNAEENFEEEGPGDDQSEMTEKTFVDK